MKKFLLIVIPLLSGFQGESSEALYLDQITENIRVQGTSEYQCIQITNMNSENWAIRKRMFLHGISPFSDSNKYNCLIIYSDKGDTIFNSPCSLITHVYYDCKSQMFVLLSKDFSFNAYQIIILNLDGQIMFTRHISPVELRYSHTEFNEMIDSLDMLESYLAKTENVYYMNDSVYVDILGFGIDPSSHYYEMLRKSGTLCENHVLRKVSLVVGGNVSFYDPTNPIESLEVSNGKVYSLTLNTVDRTKVKITSWSK